MCTIVQFSPSLIIISYALLIFQKAGTTIDPYVSSIISAVALIFGSLISTYLADKLGRKWLNLLSLIGSAVGLLVISIYYYLHINGHELSAFAWVPVASISFVIFVSSAGITPLYHLRHRIPSNKGTHDGLINLSSFDCKFCFS